MWPAPQGLVRQLRPVTEPMEHQTVMDREPRQGRTYSRREILRMAPLAVVAGVALSVVSRRLLGRRRATPPLPEDSIFAPAKDQSIRS